ncbi:N-6 DNA methylase [Marinicella sp. S1101]|uniref:type ISP restriction/modification enzyme n=1 Tax=Marinicella marina TaxID=2996016 RepID=UPI002260C76E|nr:type ISP restriction/modification enzyme [Marinicella marina]MCX7553639.1 N-6 DNA methylase [Marinicella marina]MDJ1140263.1 N-6 DNA methylase [Marinicella marina]
MDLQEYLESVTKRFNSGISGEHTYRSDLERLIRSIVPSVELTNEPSKVTDCGNPDFVITKRDIPIGFIEAKDINKDLNSKSYKEQFTRYKNALDNLIITDYLWFQFFQEGELVHEIRLAEIVDGLIITKPDQFRHFENLIEDFCTFITQSIKSSKKLAEMMAGKAKLLQNVIELAVTHDEKEEQLSTEDTWLISQYKTFKDMLIHDLKPKGFADIYAQTVAYGMFAARLHDETLDNFSRQEAAELIPKSNPFLKRLFSEIAGPNIDDRIKKIVDNLAEVFRATNVGALLKNFGKSTKTQDPIIHFYETFLAAYDPKLRKARGVWYTPEPVVDFIVRAVDDILKTEFDLKDGLADTSKTTIKVEVPTTSKQSKASTKLVDKEVHKVQILDPATGTGTFLAAVVKFIHEKKFKAIQGVWSQYVDEHLIPRLNGFELLMASYAMAHLKLDLLLKETEYKAQKNQRLNVYLTNSLEEYHPDTNDIFFSQWLSEESRAANNIKNDTPVMCVIGNPPYAVSSSNKNDWIQNLIADYKKNLNEKKINLDDDYIKFIRYGQHFIDKNGFGVLAYITNNSFIEGITHRQMRKSLLESFDKIYILNLHGDSKRQETCPDGSPDQNIFDIMQGVSINILVKSGVIKNKPLAKVYHSDLYGKRYNKYTFLSSKNITDIDWTILSNEKPFYFFIPKDIENKQIYESYFSINELYLQSNSGVQTGKDQLVTDFEKSKLQMRIKEVIESKIESEIRLKYRLTDTAGWSLAKFKTSVYNEEKVLKFTYKPFDNRWLYYDNEALKRSRYSTAKNLLKGDNYSLVSMRHYEFKLNDFSYCLITRGLILDRTFMSSKGTPYFFPLYIYPESQNNFINAERIPNLNSEMVKTIAKNLKLEFLSEEPEVGNTYLADSSEVTDAYRNFFTPLNLLDYIYAVLHSPSYRDKYKEFLKIDFPRVPYPKDASTFWQLVKLGCQIRLLHLIKSPDSENYITTYPIEGDHLVSRKMTQKSIGFEPNKDDRSLGKVWINDEQYFDDVPELAWNFYIGGYQPAQKWLKDRQGRNLSYDDILYYQKIIVALTETDRLMKEIDSIDFI